MNKLFVPSDNDENSDNAYYKYIYQVNINDKIKKGSFRIYCLDGVVIKNLNLGDVIEVNKFLFVISIDNQNVIKGVRQSYKEKDKNNDLYEKHKKNISNKFKRDLIIGLSIFAVILCGCLIYVFSIIK